MFFFYFILLRKSKLYYFTVRQKFRNKVETKNIFIFLFPFWYKVIKKYTKNYLKNICKYKNEREMSKGEKILKIKIENTE